MTSDGSVLKKYEEKMQASARRDAQRREKSTQAEPREMNSTRVKREWERQRQGVIRARTTRRLAEV